MKYAKPTIISFTIIFLLGTLFLVEGWAQENSPEKIQDKNPLEILPKFFAKQGDIRFYNEVYEKFGRIPHKVSSGVLSSKNFSPGHFQ